MKRIIFFYLMSDNQNEIKQNAPKHMLYWKGKNLDSYEGGPFSDFAGGCITFSSNSMEASKELIMNDPFMINGCLKEYWMKEWMSGDH